jgi:hypothetical protein
MKLLKLTKDYFKKVTEGFSSILGSLCFNKPDHKIIKLMITEYILENNMYLLISLSFRRTSSFGTLIIGKQPLNDDSYKKIVERTLVEYLNDALEYIHPLEYLTQEEIEDCRNQLKQYSINLLPQLRKDYTIRKSSQYSFKMIVGAK